MGALSKAQELRAYLGLAIKLRMLAQSVPDIADTELFLAAALALEDRANQLAFGVPAPQLPRCKIDLIC